MAIRKYLRKRTNERLRKTIRLQDRAVEKSDCAVRSTCLTVLKISILLFQLFFISSCSTIMQVNNNDAVRIENVKKEDLKEFIGKRIILVGKTVDQKLGAVLILENGQQIYMSDMTSWPEGYYVHNNKKECKTVEVTGILIEQHDLPVFQENNDPIIQQGIPIEQGTDLKKASQRFLFKEYTWVEKSK